MRYSVFFFLHGVQHLIGKGRLIIEPSWSYLDTPQSVGIFWTSEQSDAVTCSIQRKTLTTDRTPWPRGDMNPHSQQASDRIPTP